MQGHGLDMTAEDDQVSREDGLGASCLAFTIEIRERHNLIID